MYLARIFRPENEPGRKSDFGMVPFYGHPIGGKEDGEGRWGSN
jgi:hypothetical protein